MGPVKGNQYIKYPNKNIKAVLFNILNNTVALDNFSHLGKTKLIAFPTANKKEGKTKSVGVNPFHAA
jgi:hypothetical protein